MPVTIERKLERAGLKAANALVDNEALAVKKIRDTVQQQARIVMAGLGAMTVRDRSATVLAYRRINAGAEAIEREVAADIVEIRGNGRAQARDAMIAYLALIMWALAKGKKNVPDGMFDALGTPDSVELDYASAIATARSLAGRWQKQTLIRLDDWTKEVEGVSVSDIADPNAEALEAQIQTIGITENSTASGDETGLLFDAVSERVEGTILEPELMKRWEAILDKATCATCAALDGITVPVGESFPGGEEPGDVHPRDRCIAVLFLADEFFE